MDSSQCPWTAFGMAISEAKGAGFVVIGGEGIVEGPTAGIAQVVEGSGAGEMPAVAIIGIQDPPGEQTALVADADG